MKAITKEQKYREQYMHLAELRCEEKLLNFRLKELGLTGRESDETWRALNPIRHGLEDELEILRAMIKTKEDSFTIFSRSNFNQKFGIL